MEYINREGVQGERNEIGRDVNINNHRTVNINDQKNFLMTVVVLLAIVLPTLQNGAIVSAFSENPTIYIIFVMFFVAIVLSALQDGTITHATIQNIKISVYLLILLLDIVLVATMGTVAFDNSTYKNIKNYEIWIGILCALIVVHQLLVHNMHIHSAFVQATLMFTICFNTPIIGLSLVKFKALYVSFQLFGVMFTAYYIGRRRQTTIHTDRDIILGPAQISTILLVNNVVSYYNVPDNTTYKNILYYSLVIEQVIASVYAKSLRCNEGNSIELSIIVSAAFSFVFAQFAAYSENFQIGVVKLAALLRLPAPEA